MFICFNNICLCQNKYLQLEHGNIINFKRVESTPHIYSFQKSYYFTPQLNFILSDKKNTINSFSFGYTKEKVINQDTVNQNGPIGTGNILDRKHTLKGFGFGYGIGKENFYKSFLLISQINSIFNISIPYSENQTQYFIDANKVLKYHTSQNTKIPSTLTTDLSLKQGIYYKTLNKLYFGFSISYTLELKKEFGDRKVEFTDYINPTNSENYTRKNLGFYTISNGIVPYFGLIYKLNKSEN
jgi:hypothetical protein